MHHLAILTIAARGSFKCNAACARAVVDLFRLIYHFFGWTGVLKVFGGGIAALGCFRFGVLLRTPIEPFEGHISYDPQQQRFTVHGR